MLVNDCMVRHPIMISPETPAAEAEKIMSENRVRHIPIVGDGKRLVGLITRHSLALKPADLGKSKHVGDRARFVELKGQRLDGQGRRT